MVTRSGRSPMRGKGRYRLGGRSGSFCLHVKNFAKKM